MTFNIYIRFLFSLLKLSKTPETVIYPYPLLALLAFSLSGTLDIFLLFKAILLSFVFYAGINLWNHVNDIEEDNLAGKRTVLTENISLWKFAAAVPITLYVVSFILSYLWAGKIGVIVFLAAAISTWLYSDKLIIGKKISRWKDHYVTEVLAYVIFAPTFSTLIWLVFSQPSLQGLAFSTVISAFIVSGTFLKDIKDVTGDRLAGLKTLGVIFPTETLLKTSLTLLGVYYILILLFSLGGFLPFSSIFAIVASIGLFYSIRYFFVNGWAINKKATKPIKIVVQSNLTSIVLLILVSFLQSLQLSMSHLS